MTWNIFIYFLLGVHVLICFLMVFIILMQRSKQEGLGAAFGGGLTDSMFGAQTSQVLVKTTVYLAAIFFILTISLARLYAMRNSAASSKGGAFNSLLNTTAAPASSDKDKEADSAVKNAIDTAIKEKAAQAPTSTTASAVTPAPTASASTPSAPVTAPVPAAPAKK